MLLHSSRKYQPGQIIIKKSGIPSKTTFIRYDGREFIIVMCHVCNEEKRKHRRFHESGLLSCGCDRGFNNPLKGYRKKYVIYRKSANDRDIGFFITFNEFLDIIDKNCYYCGQAPIEKIYTVQSGTKIKDTIPIFTNGIDRIDSSKGYTIDNIRPCCTKCNRMKLDYTESDFLDKIDQIYNHLLKK